MNSAAPVIDALGWTLLHFLWQGTAIAVLLWPLLRLLRRSAPVWRYAAAALALTAMIGIAGVTLVRQWPAAVAAPPSAVAAAPLPEPAPQVSVEPAVAGKSPITLPDEPARAAVPANHALPEPGAAFSWKSAVETLRPHLHWIVGGWALGVALVLVRLGHAWWLLSRLRTAAMPFSQGHWWARFGEIAAALRVSRPVRLLSSATARVPMVVGWLKPVVIVPAALFAGLPAAQLEAILAHELAHIRRHDYLVNLLQCLVEALFFYHPAVWWVSAQLRREREHCCDDIASRLCGGALPYARALTALEELRGAESVLGLAAGGRPLLQRIRRLVGVREATAFGWPAAALAIAAAVLLPLGLILAAEKPAFTPPQAAHIGIDGWSSYCVHDGTKTAFIFLAHEFSGSSTRSSHNPKIQTWQDEGTLCFRDGREVTFHRTSAAPDELLVEDAPPKNPGTTPSSDASPAAIHRETYRLTSGRVLMLEPTGIRQLDLELPPVTSGALLTDAVKKLPGNGSAIATAKQGTWTFPGGVTLRLYGEIFHATDVMTTALITWDVTKDRPAQQWHTGIASDAFANREKWAVAWEKNRPVLWIASRDIGSAGHAPDGRPIANRFKRVDFTDPSHIREDYFQNGWPEKNPPSAAVSAEMLKLMEVPSDGKLSSTIHSWAAAGNGEKVALDRVENIHIDATAADFKIKLGNIERQCPPAGLAATLKSVSTDWTAKRANVFALAAPVPRVTVSLPTQSSEESFKTILAACTEAGVGPPSGKTSSAKSTDNVSPITDGTFTAQVLNIPGQEPIALLTQRSFTASADSTSRTGKITLPVNTSDKTIPITYTWTDAEPGVIDLKVGDYAVARYDLSRGRVFFIHFEKLEFSADVFQVPAEVMVPAIDSPEALSRAAASVVQWYGASDDRALWECSRTIVPAGSRKLGKPLDAEAENIVWGEKADSGLRLGLGGLDQATAYPIDQELPVKQYIRNDGEKPVIFSPTQIFNEGVGGQIVRTTDGRVFPHRKGYQWQISFQRVRLEPGHYIALGSGPLRTFATEKDGSSTGQIGMMEHGFSAQPGEYSLQLTHGIGQFLGRPVNGNFGNPDSAPGVGEWTGVLKSAVVPLRLRDPEVRLAKAGDSESFGRHHNIEFGKGVLKLRHYNGYPGMSLVGGPWEDRSRDWKIKAPDGNYVVAWVVGSEGLWVKDAEGVTKLVVKENLTEAGHWSLDQAATLPDIMPAGVRATLQLPPVAAAAFDFRQLPKTVGAAKLEGKVFSLPLPIAGATLKMPAGRKEFYVEYEGATYGPSTANPVVEFGLKNHLLQKLREKPNTAALATLRDMIANGRGVIRDCAFRLLLELGPPQAPFDYDSLFLAMIDAGIEDENGPRELSQEARAGSTYFHNLFHTTRLEWERTRPVLAADRYDSGDKSVPDDIAWTPGPDGMSLGVRGLTDGATLMMGKPAPITLYVRNDGLNTVRASYPTEHIPVLRISVKDAQGVVHPATYRYATGLVGYRHCALAPGAVAKVAELELECYGTAAEAADTATRRDRLYNPRLAVPTGHYQLQLEYRNYQENPIVKTESNEWTDKITAKPLTIEIVADPTKLVPPSPSVRGLSLEGFPVHAATAGTPHAFDIEELYEPDSSRPGGHGQRAEVYNLQLPDEPGEVWMKLRKGSPHFYIEFQDRTIGPIPGDPFEKLNLVDYMLTQRFRPSEEKLSAEVLNLIRNGSDPCVRAACQLLQGFTPADTTAIHAALSQWLKTAAPGPAKAAAQKVLQGSGPTVRGLNLSGLPVTDESTKIADLYEPDPEHSGMFRQREMVFEMPLYDEPGNAWLKHASEAHRFYIELGEKVYGPIEGSPVEKLKLDDLLRAKLAEPAPTDALLRVAKMIKRGDEALRSAAFALMATLPEPKWRFDYDSLTEVTHEFLDREPAGAKKDAWTTTLAGLETKIKTAKDRWEAARVTLPEDAYSHGKGADELPANIVWSEPVENGLRLGLAGVGRVTMWRLNTIASFKVILCNNGDAPVKMSWTPRVDEGLRIWLTDATGRRVDAQIVMLTSLIVPTRTMLAAGEHIEFKSVSVKIVPPAENRQVIGEMVSFSAAPGDYTLHVEGRVGSFEMGSADTQVTSPAKGEWTGTIVSPAVPVTVTDGVQTVGTAPSLTVRGVELAGVPSTTDRATVTELFEPVPDKPGEIRQKSNVFFMSLGDVGPWLMCEINLDRFWIEVRPDPKVVSDVIYGPIGGSPVEKLDLAGWLRDSDKLPDPGYARRVACNMIRSGDDRLGPLALAWFDKLPQPSPPDQHDDVIAALESRLRTNPKSHTAQDHGRLLEKLAQLKKTALGAWDGERKPWSNGYSAGEPLAQLTVPVTWATTDAGGLRLGFSGVIDGEKWEPGSRHEVSVWIRNDGPEPVKFAWTPRPDDGVELLLTDESGHEIEAPIVMNSTRLFHNHSELAPGHFILLKRDVGFSVASASAGKEGGQTSFDTVFPADIQGARRFSVRCHIGITDWDDGKGHRQIRPRGEWEGTLQSGSATVEIGSTDKTASTDSGPKVDLSQLSFGPATDDGLRAAWKLDPRKDDYRVGDIVKCAVVFHNAGKASVTFQTDAWHQFDKWNATRADGSAVQVRTTWFSGMTPQRTVTLQPRESVEIPAHGVGIGQAEFAARYGQAELGAELWAQPGDEVTCHWDVQVSPSGGETLKTGPVKFKITAAPPPGPRPPIVTDRLGSIDIAKGAILNLSQVGSAEGYTNYAWITWEKARGAEADGRADITMPRSKDPKDYSLPTFVVSRSVPALWILETSGLRKIDFSKTGEVKETKWSWKQAPADFGGAPTDAQEAIRKSGAKFLSAESTQKGVRAFLAAQRVLDGEPAAGVARAWKAEETKPHQEGKKTAAVFLFTGGKNVFIRRPEGVKKDPMFGSWQYCRITELPKWLEEFGYAKSDVVAVRADDNAEFTDLGDIVPTLDQAGWTNIALLTGDPGPKRSCAARIRQLETELGLPFTGPEPKTTAVVEVAADGTYSFDGTRETLEQAVTRLTHMGATDTTIEITVKADAHAPYAAVAAFVDKAKGAGLTKVTIKTTEAAQPSADADLIHSATEAALAFFRAEKSADRVAMLHLTAEERNAAAAFLDQHPLAAEPMATLADLGGQAASSLVRSPDGGAEVRLMIDLPTAGVKHLMLVRFVDGQPLLDWETSTVFQSGLYGDLASAKPGETRTILAKPKRDDYYNRSFSDPERFVCYKLSYPGVSTMLFAYAEKGSPLVGQLDAVQTAIPLKIVVPAGDRDATQVQIVKARPTEAEATTPATKSRLELRLVAEAPGDSTEPMGMASTGGKPAETLPVEKSALVTAADVQEATVDGAQTGEPHWTINVRLTEEAGRRLSDFTSKHRGRRLAIVAHGQVISAPRIMDQIGRDIAISGNFNEAEAKALAAAIAPPPQRQDPKPQSDAKPSVILKIVDGATQAPVNSFRVIAGVPSSVSAEFEKANTVEVVNWQPHTIREGTSGELSWPLERAYNRMALRIEAEGYVPQVIPWIDKRKGSRTVPVTLLKDQGIHGRVMTPENRRPAHDATVVLAMIGRNARLKGTAFPELQTKADAKSLRDMWERPLTVTPDEKGEFTLPTEVDPTAVVLILHGDGVLELPYAEWKANPNVTLQRWGRIHGRVTWGAVRGVGRKVSLIANHGDEHGYPDIVSQYDDTTSLEDGIFVFQRVLPGLCQLSCPIRASKDNAAGITEINLDGMLTHATVTPAPVVTPVVIGGVGRTVRGRLSGRNTWDGVTFHLHPTAPHIGLPGDDEMWKAWSEWQKSPQGALFFRTGLKVAPDGTFEVPALLPGTYQIFFSQGTVKVPFASSQFTVPAEKRDEAPGPLDIGAIAAKN